LPNFRQDFAFGVCRSPLLFQLHSTMMESDMLTARSVLVVFSFVCGLALTGATAVRADEIVQTSETIGQTFNLSSYGGTFAQFNPALGTLQDVTVQFSGDITYSVSFALNSCVTSCYAEFSFSTGYSFDAPGFPVTSPFLTSSFYATANWSGATDYPDLDPQSVGRGIGSALFHADPSAFSSYEGLGQVSIAGSVSEDSDVCSGGLGCIRSDHLDLVTTLTYEYVPVPEPATMSVFLIGLLGVGTLCRAQRRVHHL
jgi:hypothetical protein